MKLLLIGVAAAALAAGGVDAAHDRGKDPAADRGKPAQVHPTADAKGNPGHATGSMAAAVETRGNDMGNASGPGQTMAGRGDAKPAKAMPGRGKPAMAAPGNSRAPANMADAGHGVRILNDGRRVYNAPGARPKFDLAATQRGPFVGCPPGLAKKHNGCMPPGLAKQHPYRPDWWGLGHLASGQYYYHDGYLVRLVGDRIGSYIPLFGGALSIGNAWPSYYRPAPVPNYYARYYNLGPAERYRHADNVIYRVDPKTSAITSIAALLTGNDIHVGAPMPTGYDIYNVPYSYRSQYRDGPNANYRYSDGYIYQLDPKTRLVTSAIELIAS